MDALSLEDAMSNFLKTSRIKDGIQALKVEEIWEQIMGKTIARYTDEIKLFKNTLFIATTVAPLKQELMFQKELIIERVNEALGEKLVTEVVIR